MAKDKLTDYDATASNNSDVGGVNTAEGMLPSKVNDAIRELMSHLADFSAGTTGVDVLNLQDDDNSASIKFQAPSAVTTTVTFTLPDGDGSNGQTLLTNGSGTLSWGSGGGGSFLGEAGGGLGDIIRVHEKQLDTDVTVATDTNGLAAGPLAIASGVTVTVSSGATLVVA
jgi:hypothetical protein|tara:strand:+ start:616 stop:1125 length:510 start_codon:yes stop_codon:yes gene_type:complete